MTTTAVKHRTKLIRDTAYFARELAKRLHLVSKTTPGSWDESAATVRRIARAADDELQREGA